MSIESTGHKTLLLIHEVEIAHVHAAVRESHFTLWDAVLSIRENTCSENQHKRMKSIDTFANIEHLCTYCHNTETNNIIVESQSIFTNSHLRSRRRLFE